MLSRYIGIEEYDYAVTLQKIDFVQQVPIVIFQM
jgi:hypothetical protein